MNISKLLLFSSLLLALPSFKSYGAGLQKPVEIFSLQYTDQSYLTNQRATAREIAALNIGTAFRGTHHDLDTLQRIVDRKIIRKDERLKLQSLGVILGDLLVKDLGLTWVVYKDHIGRSRAICVGLSKDCLFPVTMISRRIEGGADVNVRAIFEKAKMIIKPHIQYGKTKY